MYNNRPVYNDLPSTCVLVIYRRTVVMCCPHDSSTGVRSTRGLISDSIHQAHFNMASSLKKRTHLSLEKKIEVIN